MSDTAVSCPTCGKPNTYEPRMKNKGIWLWLGIFLMPYVFAWFTLRKGYSKTSQIVSFLWLAFFIIAWLTNTTDKTAQVASQEKQQSVKIEIASNEQIMDNKKQSLLYQIAKGNKKGEEDGKESKESKEPKIKSNFIITDKEREEAISAINKFISDGLILKTNNSSDNYVEIYVLNKFYALPYDYKEGLCAYPFKAYCKDEMCAIDIIDGYSGNKIGHYYLESGLSLNK